MPAGAGPGRGRVGEARFGPTRLMWGAGALAFSVAPAAARDGSDKDRLRESGSLISFEEWEGGKGGGRVVDTAPELRLLFFVSLLFPSE